MTQVYLTPTTSVHNDGIVTGAGTWPAQLDDGSDSTYVTLVLGGDGYFEVNLDDLTLPTDAVILFAKGYIRCAKNGFYVNMEVTLAGEVDNGTVTWNSAAVAQVPTILSAADADLDAATLKVKNPSSSPAALIVYEAKVLVLYIVKPVTTVTYPVEASTLTEDNTPDILWTVAYDPDMNPDELDYEVKIYDDATFTLGTVDPDVDVPYLEASGTLPYALYYGHNFTEVLPNDNYKVFVRTSYADGQWSDWDANSFTVNTPLPGVPTLTLAEDSGQARMRLRIDEVAGSVDTTYYEVERSLDGGATWERVRTSEGNGRLTEEGDGYRYYWDYELGNEVTGTYRARAVHEYTGGLGISDWSSTVFGEWTSDYAWIKNVIDQFGYSMEVNVRSYADENRPANQGVFRPLGATNPIITFDKRGPVTGTLVVRSDTLEDRETLDAILASDGPFLIQCPLSWQIPDRVVVLGDLSRQRIVDGAVLAYTDDSMEWTEVDNPTDNRLED